MSNYRSITENSARDSSTFPDSSSSLPPASPIAWGIALIVLGLVIIRRISQPRMTSQPVSPVVLPELHFTQPLQWLGYGKDLESKKQFEAAIAVYDQAIQQHPQDHRLWHERGLMLAKRQQFEAAIASYDRAYQLNPSKRDLAHERGDALLELQRFEEAIASLDIYLRYEPNSAHVLGDRGFALYRLGRYEEALQIFEQILRMEKRDRPSIQHAHYYQIETLKQLNKLDAALQSAQKAMQLYPNDSFKAQHEELCKKTA
jgi:tetratricopeptide (TPR) repeat protein